MIILKKIELSGLGNSGVKLTQIKHVCLLRKSSALWDRLRFAFKGKSHEVFAIGWGRWVIIRSRAYKPLIAVPKFCHTLNPAS